MPFETLFYILYNSIIYILFLLLNIACALCALFSISRARSDAFNTLCTDTRAEFDATKSMKDFGEIEFTYEKMNSQLFMHPEPYVIPWDRGGTAFMRNAPPAFHVRSGRFF